jgi:succinate dehydrogenase / fumarate reductase iron-sulfur subunit
MSSYTLKVRRYQPEASEDDKRGAYWESFDVELDPTLSVLDGLLQARDGTDGTLSVRCSCRAAICGSCGVRINGNSTLACKTQIGEAAAEAARTARRGEETAPITVEPMEHAGDQGPGHRHGVDPLGEVPPGDAVALAVGAAA